MRVSKSLAFLVVVVLVGATGLAGYVFGASEAPNDAEAAAAEVNARTSTLARAKASAYAENFGEALLRGRKQGKTTGDREGAAVGERSGSDDVEAKLAAIEEREAAEAAAAAQAAADAEAAERAANCGAPLFVDGYCPTDEEIDLENAAESLAEAVLPRVASKLPSVELHADG